MTNIITRYFDSAEQARKVQRELIRYHRFAPKITDLYDRADGLVDVLTGQKVEKTTAEAYAKRMASGGAVLLVRAGFKPLAVAKTTRTVTAQMGAVDMGGIDEEVFVADNKETRANFRILRDHPLLMSRRPGGPDPKYHMADWPLPLISRRKPYNEMLIERHGRMADLILPLISKRKPYTGSIFGRHARMANFPIPLISKRKPFTGSIISRHGRMAAFPIPLLSKRKPYTGSLFPRHQRMATVPFPLLINGKTGTNALIPGGKRMANFPISLLSSRKPNTASIIPRHARMANFPIPLLSSRKPYTKSAISKHGRMADAILPLVIAHAGTQTDAKSSGFSLSKYLGIPTVIRR